MEDPNIASDELIRDLYDAETAYSKAAFAVWHQAVVFLATQLLTRGGESNIRCYINFAGRGHYAWMSSQCVTLSSEQQTKAIATLASLASTVSDDLLPRFKRVQANVGRITPTTEAANHGMQRSGGGAVFGEINVNSRRPLIPTVPRFTH